MWSLVNSMDISNRQGYENDDLSAGFLGFYISCDQRGEYNIQIRGPKATALFVALQNAPGMSVTLADSLLTVQTKEIDDLDMILGLIVSHDKSEDTVTMVAKMRIAINENITVKKPVTGLIASNIFAVSNDVDPNILIVKRSQNFRHYSPGSLMASKTAAIRAEVAKFAISVKTSAGTQQRQTAAFAALARSMAPLGNKVTTNRVAQVDVSDASDETSRPPSPGF